MGELYEHRPKTTPLNDSPMDLWCLPWMTRRPQRMGIGFQGGEGDLLVGDGRGACETVLPLSVAGFVEPKIMACSEFCLGIHNWVLPL